jgi:hypothetical protein
MLKLERVFTLSEVARRSLASSTAPILPTATHCTVAKPRWHSAIVHDLSAAQEVMDRLECAGLSVSELRILGEARFEVRWRDPFSQRADGPR